MKPTPVTRSDRTKHERAHASKILADQESNWGWHTSAGRIRKARRADFLTSHNGLPGSPQVLEVGCGTGTFTEYFRASFDRLTCIDIADELLDAARVRFPGVDFVNADVHQTPFSDGAFDLVAGCSVLHHLDWPEALVELRRILRPGGQIRFSEPNLLNPQIFLQKNIPWLKRRMGDSPDEYAFTPAQISACLLESGFSEVQVCPFEFLHPSTPQGFIPTVLALERMLSRTPLVRIAGSMLIRAIKRR